MLFYLMGSIWVFGAICVVLCQTLFKWGKTFIFEKEKLYREEVNSVCREF